MSVKPCIAHVIGCPAGVAPELPARVLADPDLHARARIVAIGDSRILARGALVAGVALDLPVVGENDPLPEGDGSALIDMRRLDPSQVRVGELARGAVPLRHGVRAPARAITTRC